MVVELSKDMFISLMKRYRSEQFSTPALSTIFDYIKEYEGEYDYTVEYDPILICDSFTEFDSMENIKEEFDYGVYSNIEEIKIIPTGKSYIVVESECLC